jgi:CD109 antigen
VKLNKKIPDTITSWIITGFAVDPLTGLGLTKEPSKLTVFRPFFAALNLPYSIKRGEVIAIQVQVFNYMDSEVEAVIVLYNDKEEFEFAEVGENQDLICTTEPQRSKSIMVKPQSGVTVPFLIRPLKVGLITIKVTATTDTAGDGLEKQLIVEPEGVTQYLNQAILIDLRTNNEFTTTISIAVPLNAVPDSTKIEASAIGDILGPSLENLDNLM